jgi:hypothetical protein
MEWRKSSYSNANGGDCVEVGNDSSVLIRDTKNRNGVTIEVPAEAWTTFLASVR